MTLQVKIYKQRCLPYYSRKILTIYANNFTKLSNKSTTTSYEGHQTRLFKVSVYIVYSATALLYFMQLLIPFLIISNDKSINYYIPIMIISRKARPVQLYINAYLTFICSTFVKSSKSPKLRIAHTTRSTSTVTFFSFSLLLLLFATMVHIAMAQDFRPERKP